MHYEAFIKDYISIQKDITIDDIIYYDNYTLVFSRTDKSELWNFAVVEDNKKVLLIEPIEQVFNLKQRRPCFYCIKTSPHIKTIINAGYHKTFTDSWFFWQSKETIPTQYFDTIKQVESKEELEIYIQTLDACFQKDDPKNPYGALWDYLISAKEARITDKEQNINKLVYFICYKEETPVAVSALAMQWNLAYISNVWSLRVVRWEWYGKAVSLFPLQYALGKGINNIALSTEEGYFPYEFYKRLWFIQMFDMEYYVKDE